MTGYPKWFSESLLAMLALLLATGLLLVPTVLELRLEWDFVWRLTGDQRITVAALHVAASFVVFAFSGALWAVHIRRGWKMRLNRASGITLVSLILSLLLSGVGIYYLGGEISSAVASLSHTALGVAAGLCFAIHFVRGRAIKAAAQARDEAGQARAAQRAVNS
jgi:heme A synthase